MERKALTRSIVIDGITFRVPIGSMDKPDAESERIMKLCQNPSNWKLATTPYITFDKNTAENLAYCFNWYLGGHEIRAIRTRKQIIAYVVSSKGYYHYIGA